MRHRLFRISDLSGSQTDTTVNNYDNNNNNNNNNGHQKKSVKYGILPFSYAFQWTVLETLGPVNVLAVENFQSFRR